MHLWVAGTLPLSGIVFVWGGKGTAGQATHDGLVAVVKDEEVFMEDLVPYIGTVPAVFGYSCPLCTSSGYALRHNSSHLKESKAYEGNVGGDAWCKCCVWACREVGGGDWNRGKGLELRFGGFLNEGSCEHKEPCMEDHGEVS